MLLSFLALIPTKLIIISSVHSGLQCPHSYSFWREHVNVGSPTWKRVTIKCRQKTIAHNFSKFFWTHIWFVESFAAASEEVSASTSCLKNIWVLTVANWVISCNNWFVLRLADLIQSANNRGNEVWSKSKSICVVIFACIWIFESELLDILVTSLTFSHTWLCWQVWKKLRPSFHGPPGVCTCSS